MAFFERFRARPGPSPEQLTLSAAADRLRDAHKQLTAAEGRKNYADAQLTELLPDIRERTALEIRERAAGTRLEGNRSRQEHLRKLLSLIREVRAHEPSGEYAAKERKAAAELEQLEGEEQSLAAEHEALESRLSSLKISIAERDKELRKRFGLPDQD